MVESYVIIYQFRRYNGRSFSQISHSYIYIPSSDTCQFSVMVIETVLFFKNIDKIVTNMTLRGKTFQVREKPEKPRLVFLDIS